MEINIRAELNTIEDRKTIETINTTKCWLFKKINKVNKMLARLNKKRKIKPR